MKTCTKCKIEKPVEQFSVQKVSRDGRRPRCKECTSIADRTYNKKHSKKRAKTTREWQKNNPKRYKKILTKALNKRKEAILAQTPEQTALELSAMDSLYIMARILSNSCGEPFHVDHIIPISKGGLHHFDNLQIISAEENLKKGNYLASL